jgi:hypothetical protein
LHTPWKIVRKSQAKNKLIIIIKKYSESSIIGALDIRYIKLKVGIASQFLTKTKLKKRNQSGRDLKKESRQRGKKKWKQFKNIFINRNKNWWN